VSAARLARGNGAQHAASDERAEHKQHEGDDWADDRQVIGAGESHTEDHDVAGQVAGEDAVETEVRIRNRAFEAISLLFQEGRNVVD